MSNPTYDSLNNDERIILRESTRPLIACRISKRQRSRAGRLQKLELVEIGVADEKTLRIVATDWGRLVYEQAEPPPFFAQATGLVDAFISVMVEVNHPNPEPQVLARKRHDLIREIAGVMHDLTTKSSSDDP